MQLAVCSNSTRRLLKFHKRSNLLAILLGCLILALSWFPPTWASSSLPSEACVEKCSSTSVTVCLHNVGLSATLPDSHNGPTVTVAVTALPYSLSENNVNYGIHERGVSSLLIPTGNASLTITGLRPYTLYNISLHILSSDNSYTESAFARTAAWTCGPQPGVERTRVLAYDDSNVLLQVSVDPQSVAQQPFSDRLPSEQNQILSQASEGNQSAVRLVNSITGFKVQAAIGHGAQFRDLMFSLGTPTDGLQAGTINVGVAKQLTSDPTMAWTGSSISQGTILLMVRKPASSWLSLRVVTVSRHSSDSDPSREVSTFAGKLDRSARHLSVLSTNSTHIQIGASPPLNARACRLAFRKTSTGSQSWQYGPSEPVSSSTVQTIVTSQAVATSAQQQRVEVAVECRSDYSSDAWRFAPSFSSHSTLSQSVFQVLHDVALEAPANVTIVAIDTSDSLRHEGNLATWLWITWDGDISPVEAILQAKAGPRSTQGQPFSPTVQAFNMQPPITLSAIYGKNLINVALPKQGVAYSLQLRQVAPEGLSKAPLSTPVEVGVLSPPPKASVWAQRNFNSTHVCLCARFSEMQSSLEDRTSSTVLAKFFWRQKSSVNWLDWRDVQNMNSTEMKPAGHTRGVCRPGSQSISPLSPLYSVPENDELWRSIRCAEAMLPSTTGILSVTASFAWSKSKDMALYSSSANNQIQNARTVSPLVPGHWSVPVQPILVSSESLIASKFESVHVSESRLVVKLGYSQLTPSLIKIAAFVRPLCGSKNGENCSANSAFDQSCCGYIPLGSMHAEAAKFTGFELPAGVSDNMSFEVVLSTAMGSGWAGASITYNNGVFNERQMCLGADSKATLSKSNLYGKGWLRTIVLSRPDAYMFSATNEEISVAVTDPLNSLKLPYQLQHVTCPPLPEMDTLATAYVSSAHHTQHEKVFDISTSISPDCMISGDGTQEVCLDSDHDNSVSEQSANFGRGQDYIASISTSSQFAIHNRVHGRLQMSLRSLQRDTCMINQVISNDNSDANVNSGQSSVAKFLDHACLVRLKEATSLISSSSPPLAMIRLSLSTNHGARQPAGLGVTNSGIKSSPGLLAALRFVALPSSLVGSALSGHGSQLIPVSMSAISNILQLPSPGLLDTSLHEQLKLTAPPSVVSFRPPSLTVVSDTNTSWPVQTFVCETNSTLDTLVFGRNHARLNNCSGIATESCRPAISPEMQIATYSRVSIISTSNVGYSRSQLPVVHNLSSQNFQGSISSFLKPGVEVIIRQKFAGADASNLVPDVDVCTSVIVPEEVSIPSVSRVRRGSGEGNPSGDSQMEVTLSARDNLRWNASRPSTCRLLGCVGRSTTPQILRSKDCQTNWVNLLQVGDLASPMEWASPFDDLVLPNITVPGQSAVTILLQCANAFRSTWVSGDLIVVPAVMKPLSMPHSLKASVSSSWEAPNIDLLQLQWSSDFHSTTESCVDMVWKVYVSHSYSSPALFNASSSAWKLLTTAENREAFVNTRTSPCRSTITDSGFLALSCGRSSKHFSALLNSSFVNDVLQLSPAIQGFNFIDFAVSGTCAEVAHPPSVLHITHNILSLESDAVIIRKVRLPSLANISGSAHSTARVILSDGLRSLVRVVAPSWSNLAIISASGACPTANASTMGNSMIWTDRTPECAQAPSPPYSLATFAADSSGVHMTLSMRMPQAHAEQPPVNLVAILDDSIAGLKPKPITWPSAIDGSISIKLPAKYCLLDMADFCSNGCKGSNLFFPQNSSLPASMTPYLRFVNHLGGRTDKSSLDNCSSTSLSGVVSRQSFAHDTARIPTFDDSERLSLASDCSAQPCALLLFSIHASNQSESLPVFMALQDLLTQRAFSAAHTSVVGVALISIDQVPSGQQLFPMLSVPPVDQGTYLHVQTALLQGLQPQVLDSDSQMEHDFYTVTGASTVNDFDDSLIAITIKPPIKHDHVSKPLLRVIVHCPSVNGHHAPLSLFVSSVDAASRSVIYAAYNSTAQTQQAQDVLVGCLLSLVDIEQDGQLATLTVTHVLDDWASASFVSDGQEQRGSFQNGTWFAFNASISCASGRNNVASEQTGSWITLTSGQCRGASFFALFTCSGTQNMVFAWSPQSDDSPCPPATGNQLTAYPLTMSTKTNVFHRQSSFNAVFFFAVRDPTLDLLQPAEVIINAGVCSAPIAGPHDPRCLVQECQVSYSLKVSSWNWSTPLTIANGTNVLSLLQSDQFANGLTLIGRCRAIGSPDFGKWSQPFSFRGGQAQARSSSSVVQMTVTDSFSPSSLLVDLSLSDASCSRVIFSATDITSSSYSQVLLSSCPAHSTSNSQGTVTFEIPQNSQPSFDLPSATQGSTRTIKNLQLCSAHKEPLPGRLQLNAQLHCPGIFTHHSQEKVSISVEHTREALCLDSLRHLQVSVRPSLRPTANWIVKPELPTNVHDSFALDVKFSVNSLHPQSEVISLACLQRLNLNVTDIASQRYSGSSTYIASPAVSIQQYHAAIRDGFASMSVCCFSRASLLEVSLVDSAAVAVKDFSLENIDHYPQTGKTVVVQPGPPPLAPTNLSLSASYQNVPSGNRSFRLKCRAQTMDQENLVRMAPQCRTMIQLLPSFQRSEDSILPCGSAEDIAQICAALTEQNLGSRLSNINSIFPAVYSLSDSKYHEDIETDSNLQLAASFSLNSSESYSHAPHFSSKELPAGGRPLWAAIRISQSCSHIESNSSYVCSESGHIFWPPVTLTAASEHQSLFAILPSTSTAAIKACVSFGNFAGWSECSSDVIGLLNSTAPIPYTISDVFVPLRSTQSRHSNLHTSPSSVFISDSSSTLVAEQHGLSVMKVEWLRPAIMPSSAVAICTIRGSLPTISTHIVGNAVYVTGMPDQISLTEIELLFVIPPSNTVVVGAQTIVFPSIPSIHKALSTKNSDVVAILPVPGTTAGGVSSSDQKFQLVAKSSGMAINELRDAGVVRPFTLTILSGVDGEEDWQFAVCPKNSQGAALLCLCSQFIAPVHQQAGLPLLSSAKSLANATLLTLPHHQNLLFMNIARPQNSQPSESIISNNQINVGRSASCDETCLANSLPLESSKGPLNLTLLNTAAAENGHSSSMFAFGWASADSVVLSTSVTAYAVAIGTGDRPRSMSEAASRSSQYATTPGNSHIFALPTNNTRNVWIAVCPLQHVLENDSEIPQSLFIESMFSSLNGISSTHPVSFTTINQYKDPKTGHSFLVLDVIGHGDAAIVLSPSNAQMTLSKYSLLTGFERSLVHPDFDGAPSPIATISQFDGTSSRRTVTIGPLSGLQRWHVSIHAMATSDQGVQLPATPWLRVPDCVTVNPTPQCCADVTVRSSGSQDVNVSPNSQDIDAKLNVEKSAGSGYRLSVFFNLPNTSLFRIEASCRLLTSCSSGEWCVELLPLQEMTTRGNRTHAKFSASAGMRIVCTLSRLDESGQQHSAGSVHAIWTKSIWRRSFVVGVKVTDVQFVGKQKKDSSEGLVVWRPPLGPIPSLYIVAAGCETNATTATTTGAGNQRGLCIIRHVRHFGRGSDKQTAAFPMNLPEGIRVFVSPAYSVPCDAGFIRHPSMPCSLTYSPFSLNASTNTADAKLYQLPTAVTLEFQDSVSLSWTLEKNWNLAYQVILEIACLSVDQVQKATFSRKIPFSAKYLHLANVTDISCGNLPLPLWLSISPTISSNQWSLSSLTSPRYVIPFARLDIKLSAIQYDTTLSNSKISVQLKLTSAPAHGHFFVGISSLQMLQGTTNACRTFSLHALASLTSSIAPGNASNYIPSHWKFLQQEVTAEMIAQAEDFHTINSHAVRLFTSNLEIDKAMASQRSALCATWIPSLDLSPSILDAQSEIIRQSLAQPMSIVTVDAPTPLATCGLGTRTATFQWYSNRHLYQLFVDASAKGSSAETFFSTLNSSTLVTPQKYALQVSSNVNEPFETLFMTPHIGDVLQKQSTAILLESLRSMANDKGRVFLRVMACYSSGPTCEWNSPASETLQLPVIDQPLYGLQLSVASSETIVLPEPIDTKGNVVISGWIRADPKWVTTRLSFNNGRPAIMAAVSATPCSGVCSERSCGFGGLFLGCMIGLNSQQSTQCGAGFYVNVNNDTQGFDPDYQIDFSNGPVHAVSELVVFAASDDLHNDGWFKVSAEYEASAGCILIQGRRVCAHTGSQGGGVFNTTTIEWGVACRNGTLPFQGSVDEILIAASQSSHPALAQLSTNYPISGSLTEMAHLFASFDKPKSDDPTCLDSKPSFRVLTSPNQALSTMSIENAGVSQPSSILYNQQDLPLLYEQGINAWNAAGDEISGLFPSIEVRNLQPSEQDRKSINGSVSVLKLSTVHYGEQVAVSIAIRNTNDSLPGTAHWQLPKGISSKLYSFISTADKSTAVYIVILSPKLIEAGSNGSVCVTLSRAPNSRQRTAGQKFQVHRLCLAIHVPLCSMRVWRNSKPLHEFAALAGVGASALASLNGLASADLSLPEGSIVKFGHIRHVPPNLVKCVQGSSSLAQGSLSPEDLDSCSQAKATGTWLSHASSSFSRSAGFPWRAFSVLNARYLPVLTKASMAPNPDEDGLDWLTTITNAGAVFDMNAIATADVCIPAF